MEERKEISLEELDQRIERHGPNVALSNVHVSGVVTIRDKDGNIKQEMDIVSLEVNEDTQDAASNSTP